MGRGGRYVLSGQRDGSPECWVIMRDRAVAQTTDLLARMNDELRSRGIRFLVAPPPNASSVYPEDLPLRAQNAGRPTKYDLLLANLAAKGVPAVDLRPVLKKARPGGSLFYMHDTHLVIPWRARGVQRNRRGGLYPDWRIDPSSALRPAVRKGGDMASILGLADKISDN